MQVCYAKEIVYLHGDNELHLVFANELRDAVVRQHSNDRMATEIKAPTIDIATTPSDVQRGDVESCNRHAMQTEVKRDLQRRHINMIAIAGMIVSTIQHTL